jgi:dTDP-4-amino-4,6-dideoxygalactose transaminase
MIPRGTPDIGWRDLLAGVCDCLFPPSEAQAQAAVEAASGGLSLACLSVRSAFDLLLQALALPPGSEVLVSAVTIPDMLRVLEYHGLVAVPVDLHMEQMTIDAATLERAVTASTRAVLVAHLFGSRIELEPVVAFAHKYDLLLLEDCAQAYDGSYQGHLASDAALFSFGPIKTSTALGGAILRLREPSLLTQVRLLQAAYPVQPRVRYLQRVIRFLLLKMLARPALFAALVALCRLGGQNHDTLLRSLLRGFPTGDLITQLRLRPSGPLLAMLARRLRQSSITRRQVAQRIALARRIVAALCEQPFVGMAASHHTHWALPLRSQNPTRLAQLLWSVGIDASSSVSSLIVVAAPAGRDPAAETTTAMEKLIYLPLHSAMDEASLRRMVAVVRAVEQAPD